MSIQQTISQLANQCVLCGLCLPHCPTYQLFHTENESPRGRISLFKAVAEGQLEVNEALMQPLEHCLSCRACEKMCPSQVKYSRINLLGRQLIASQKVRSFYFFRTKFVKQVILCSLWEKAGMRGFKSQQTWLQQLSEKLLLNPHLHPWLKTITKFTKPLLTGSFSLWEKTGMRAKESHSLPLLKTFTNEISSSPIKLQRSYPISDPDKAKGQVLLFKGCSADLFEQQIILDAIKLLNACYFNVSIPDKQSCCGAIKLRHGDHKGMLLQAQQNIKAFSNENSYEAIISLNSSCSGQLNEYAELDSLISNAKAFSHKSSDLVAFLYKHISVSQLKFAPLEQQVLVHTACSLKNVLQEEQLLYQLLELIPAINLHKLNSQYCCGAAGSYMLQYPKVSNQLLHDKLEEIKQQDSQLLVSSNIGCSLHFKQGLEYTGQKVEVIHPVTLLARQLLKSPLPEGDE